MDSSTPIELQIAHNIPPFLIQFKDGSIHRLVGTQQAPPGFDPSTRVTSKDIFLQSDTQLCSRIYMPEVNPTNENLPLVIYFHGGAFLVGSPSEPLYHGFCNALAGSSKALVVSVGYRLAPENPLPTAFHDAWAAIEWIAAHAGRDGPECWINNEANFNRVFLLGDSAGATLAHHVATQNNFVSQVKICGIGLIHPYFWGTNQVGSEESDSVRRDLVNKWWEYVCPSDKGCDDSLINPFSDEAPSLDGVECERMLVMVAEKDILRGRGRLYYDEMVKMNKRVNTEYYETVGEDHVFYLFDPHSDKAKDLVSELTSFINQPSRSYSFLT